MFYSDIGDFDTATGFFQKAVEADLDCLVSAMAFVTMGVVISENAESDSEADSARNTEDTETEPISSMMIGEVDRLVDFYIVRHQDESVSNIPWLKKIHLPKNEKSKEDARNLLMFAELDNETAATIEASSAQTVHPI